MNKLLAAADSSIGSQTPRAPTKAEVPHRPTPAEYGLGRLLYSVDETAELLSRGRTAVYALVGDGKLKPIKDGKRTFFAAQNIVDVVEGMKRDSLKASPIVAPRGHRHSPVDQKSAA